MDFRQYVALEPGDTLVIDITSNRRSADDWTIFEIRREQVEAKFLFDRLTLNGSGTPGTRWRLSHHRDGQPIAVFADKERVRDGIKTQRRT